MDKQRPSIVIFFTDDQGYPERFQDLKTKLLAHDHAVRTEGGTLDVAERGA